VKKKKHYFNNRKPQKKIVFGKGKGKEYSEVSRELENTFRRWIEYAEIDTEEFDRRMKAEPHKVEENINKDGDIEINIYAGGDVVIVPLVFPVNDGGVLDDFIVNALLLLSLIASRYESKSFEKAVSLFADRMVAEKKLIL